MSRETGRLGQKARTRAALIAAAQDAIRAGGRPSVDDVARATGISRRTAYRYFDSREALVAEAVLEAIEPEAERLLDAIRAQPDVPRRLEALVRGVVQLVAGHEAELRAMARVAAGPRPEVAWVDAAVAPLRGRMGSDALDRLASALSACVGVSAVLALRDLRGLPPDRIEELASWMGRTMLREALAAAPAA